MLQATAILTLDTLGNTVILRDVTPAEALFLRRSFKGRSRGPAVHIVEETGSVDRSPSAEKVRLFGKYKRVQVEEAFPGEMPNMPEDFSGFPQGTPEPPKPKRKDDE